MDMPPSLSDNPADYYLSHPYRAQKLLGEHSELILGMLGPRESKLLQDSFRDESFLLPAVELITRTKNMPALLSFLEASAFAPGSTEMGGAMPVLFAMRHIHAPYRIFRLEDGLTELLDATDVAEDIPLDFLKMPFNRFYLELGTKRSIPYVVPNDMSGDHVLEGAYFEQGVHPEFGKGLYVLMTGSPLGKSGTEDDATQGIFLPLENTDGMTLHNAIGTAYDRATAAARDAGLILPMGQDDSQRNMVLLCKALLYISMPEVRRTVNLKFTELQKRLMAVKSSAKQAKLLRKEGRVADEILIHAPAAVPGGAGAGAGGDGVAPAWRRGHFKNQPHGPQWSLRKLIFVAPYLIHANAEGDAGPAPKNYAVR